MIHSMHDYKNRSPLPYLSACITGHFRHVENSGLSTILASKEKWRISEVQIFWGQRIFWVKKEDWRLSMVRIFCIRYFQYRPNRWTHSLHLWTPGGKEEECQFWKSHEAKCPKSCFVRALTNDPRASKSCLPSLLLQERRQLLKAQSGHKFSSLLLISL